MALPPDPIELIFGDVVGCVAGEVVAVAQLPPADRIGNPGDDSGLAPPQTAELSVARVLFGAMAPGRLQVHKPAAPYLLRPGHHGLFLLRSTPRLPGQLEIVGRYGPDSYTEDEILAEARHRRLV